MRVKATFANIKSKPKVKKRKLLGILHMETGPIDIYPDTELTEEMLKIMSPSDKLNLVALKMSESFKRR